MLEGPTPLHFRITFLKIVSILVANTLIALFIIALYPASRFMVSFISSQCIGLSIATCSIAATNLIRTKTQGLHLAFIIASVILGALIGVEVSGIAVRSFVPGVGQALSTPEEKTGSYISNLLYALLFGSIISYVFISLQRISDEKLKRLEVEKSAAITEIKLLQSQMEPHFLFNTLSNILGLIDPDPPKAKRMLEAFTLFLRASLVTARSETISLSQEMDVVKNYLDILSVRMGDRLKYAVDLPNDLGSVRVPPLLVQPLVENAVKHGLEPSVSGGELRITCAREGDAVRITVADSGQGINELSPGNGISLENIKKRLALVYNGRASLVFEENKPTGVKAIIEFPYAADTSNHS